MRKNYFILNSISEMKLTQAQVARQARISSEARLSRIIHYLVVPTDEEISALKKVLNLSAEELGKGRGYVFRG